MSNKKTQIFIDLYKANWCGACQNFFPTWTQLEKVINSKNVQSMLKSENIEINMKCYEETTDSEIMIKEKIRSYPTIKISILTNNNKNSVNLSNRAPETIINEAFSPCSDNLKKLIIKEFHTPSNMSGGYFDYVTKPHLRYYNEYLKCKNKYLALKNITK